MAHDGSADNLQRDKAKPTIGEAQFVLSVWYEQHTSSICRFSTTKVVVTSVFVSVLQGWCIPAADMQHANVITSARQLGEGPAHTRDRGMEEPCRGLLLCRAAEYS